MQLVLWILVRIPTYPLSWDEAAHMQQGVIVDLSKRFACLGDDASLSPRRINTRRTLASLFSLSTDRNDIANLKPPSISSILRQPETPTMQLFSSSPRRSRATTSTRTRNTRFRNPLRRRDPDRVAGGYKSALSNPNTTHSGRKHAKRELRLMVSTVVFP